MIDVPPGVSACCPARRFVSGGQNIKVSLTSPCPMGYHHLSLLNAAPYIIDRSYDNGPLCRLSLGDGMAGSSSRGQASMTARTPSYKSILCYYSENEECIRRR